MKRIFDIVLSGILFVLFFVPMVIVAIYIKLVSKGPALYWSKRVGKNNNIFLMPKFRTMLVDTPQLASHKMKNADQFLIFGGRLLRKTSLDELPQLWSILKGQMTFVGPRPALFNQDDLIALRTEKNIHKLLPGVTGWAQINGRDDLSIPQKVKFDYEYLKFKSSWFDLKIFLMTVFYVFKRKGISH